MITTKSATDIATSINAAGDKYFGASARAWVGSNESRIYFGREWVTITSTGEITNAQAGRARAKTIGSPALELVEKHG